MSNNFESSIFFWKKKDDLFHLSLYVLFVSARWIKSQQFHSIQWKKCREFGSLQRCLKLRSNRTGNCQWSAWTEKVSWSWNIRAKFYNSDYRLKKINQSCNQYFSVSTDCAQHWIGMKILEIIPLTWSSLFWMMPHFLFVFNIFRYRDGFDTILINDASKISELDTLPALEFSPSSIILFGDERRLPEDRYRLFNDVHKHSKKSISLKKTFYQTIFHRFRSHGH